ncbi:MAG: PA0069 family radical SAM protein [Bacteroidetes bacterium]|nr:PA0069 family radical SAM protein [Bacteroidota bacterium]
MDIKHKKYKKGRGAQISVENPYDRQFYVNLMEGEEEDSNTRTKYINVHPKTIVNKVDSPDVPMNISLNPYQGCEHGCIYCYARNSHEFWGYNAGLEFERFILVKEDAPALLEKKILSKNWKVEPIMLSGNTDCYQPVEQKLNITRELLKVCVRYRHPVGIITKNAMILRDLDLLADLAKDNLVQVVLSITGVDESLRSKMEPRTTTFKKRFKTIEVLASRGIPVRVMMAPVIPGLNSEAIMDVARHASNAGALGLSYTMIRLNGRLEPVFRDWIERNYPDRSDKVMKQIASLHGGRVQDSRFGTRMKGEGKIAAIIRQQFSVARNLYFKGRKIPEYNLNAFRREQLTLF